MCLESLCTKFGQKNYWSSGHTLLLGQWSCRRHSRSPVVNLPKICHRQVKALNLTSTVHSTMHTPQCMSLIGNSMLEQETLIQVIMDLHLRIGIFCHHHHGKPWRHVGLWCVIAANVLVWSALVKQPWSNVLCSACKWQKKEDCKNPYNWYNGFS